MLTGRLMEIQFSTTKMKKACSEEKQMKKQWGDRTVKKLKQRLAELVLCPSYIVG